MKKIILIITSLFLFGCYNYIEVNNLCFISSIGIDYQNNLFDLTIELIEEKQEQKATSSTINVQGKTISEAFNNISTSINKKPFYYHLKAIVISKEVAKNHLEELTDYFLRSPEIRKEFYLVVSENAKDILSLDMNNSTVGDAITSTIKTSYNKSSYNRSFQDFLEKVLNDKMDALTTELSIKNNKLKINGIALFSKYHYIDTVYDDDATLLNILNNNPASLLISKKYNDKTFSISAYEGKTSYIFKNNKVIINVNLKAEINENDPAFDLHKEKIYEKLNQDFSKVVEKDVYSLLNKIRNYNCDPLGLTQKLFVKNRKVVHNIMDKYDFKVNVDLVINRKGLIYKVEDE